MELTNKEKAIHLCMHAVGFSDRDPYKRHGKLFFKSYRNRYNAAENNVPVWEELVSLGYAYKNRMYHMTEKGLEWFYLQTLIKVKIDD